MRLPISCICKPLNIRLDERKRRKVATLKALCAKFRAPASVATFRFSSK
jgi:hypothetical protein